VGKRIDFSLPGLVGAAQDRADSGACGPVEHLDVGLVQFEQRNGLNSVGVGADNNDDSLDHADNISVANDGLPDHDINDIRRDLLISCVVGYGCRGLSCHGHLLHLFPRVLESETDFYLVWYE